MVKPLLSKHVTKFPNTRHYQSWRVVFYVPRYWLQRYDKNHISGTFLPSFFIFSVFSLFTYLSHPLILDLMLLTDASQPANAMSCCCSVVPALWSILPCKAIASFLRPVGSKRQSRAPLRHSPTVVTHPQGRHVFGEIIPNIHKTPEHLFRLSPPIAFFVSL